MSFISHVLFKMERYQAMTEPALRAHLISVMGSEFTPTWRVAAKTSGKFSQRYKKAPQMLKELAAFMGLPAPVETETPRAPRPAGPRAPRPVVPRQTVPKRRNAHIKQKPTWLTNNGRDVFAYDKRSKAKAAKTAKKIAHKGGVSIKEYLEQPFNSLKTDAQLRGIYFTNSTTQRELARKVAEYDASDVAIEDFRKFRKNAIQNLRAMHDPESLRQLEKRKRLARSPSMSPVSSKMSPVSSKMSPSSNNSSSSNNVSSKSKSVGRKSSPVLSTSSFRKAWGPSSSNSSLRSNASISLATTVKQNSPTISNVSQRSISKTTPQYRLTPDELRRWNI